MRFARPCDGYGVMTNMRVVLFGGTDLTRRVAAAFEEIGMLPCAVVTLPESLSLPGGKVKSTRFADLHEWARPLRIPVHVHDGDKKALKAFLVGQAGEFALFAGWYYMVGSDVRSLFERGCAGLHASLLPKLRGFAPLNWALLTGQSETGVTMFAFGDGVDDGPVYGQRRFAINAKDYIGDIVSRSSDACVELVKTLLPEIASGALEPQPQQGEASYGLQRFPEDGAIDWTRPADDIARLVRAVSRPYPGAYSHLDGRRIIIWRARPALSAPAVYGVVGQIARLPRMENPLVVTGQGLVEIEEAVFEDGTDALATILRSGHRRFCNRATSAPSDGNRA